MAEIININQLLKMKLYIPPYQRPYKWTIRNMEELLVDINHSIKDSQQYKDGFKYRIGTVILHKTGNGKYSIVDGQQRIISLVLLKLYLDKNFRCTILRHHFSNKVSQTNIHINFGFIREWFSLKTNTDQEKFSHALEDILEVVVIQVDQVSEAFQLFDSQNTRGKALDPHDLLKAYHLREMKDDPYEMEHAVTKWEAKDTSSIRDLFDLFLYPIWNWSHGKKSKSFTSKEIDTYKGITEKTAYSYAKRAGKAMPYFQITEPFIAGNDFFEFVEHYLNLLGDIKKEIKTKSDFIEIWEIIDMRTDSPGFGYARNLFFCALFMYYDKFHNFDVMAVKKLFTWAFMLRIDMENLGFDSINKYAVGDHNERYTNVEPVFFEISLARVHTEISNLQIKPIREPDRAAAPKWNDLYKRLKKLNGYQEG